MEVCFSKKEKEKDGRMTKSVHWHSTTVEGNHMPSFFHSDIDAEYTQIHLGSV